jgi:hypothetical protein
MTSAKMPLLRGENPGIHHIELQLNVKPTAAVLLVGTPTFIVSTQTLDQFAADDFPLIVVADHHGIIRWVQVASDNALLPGGSVDQIVDHVIHQWDPPSQ